MTATRALLPDFNVANPLYAGATVTVYEADADGVVTATLADIYDGLTGSGTLGNPLTLDGEGKWQTPPYVDVAVIMAISGGSVSDHSTGVEGPPISDISADTPWTPTLIFGSASTGITYSTRLGTYTQVGTLVFYSGSIILSSKGSATGAAIITGLPGLPSAQGNFGVHISYSANFNGLTGLPVMILKSASSDGHISIHKDSTNGATEQASVTDAEFSNSTNLYFNGWYRTS